MKFSKLERGVVDWASNRGLFNKSSPQKQLLKSQEELDELKEAVDMGDLNDIEEELGDVLVTMVVQAHFWGLSAKDCLETSLNKINGRSGSVVDGLYVKDQ